MKQIKAMIEITLNTESEFMESVTEDLARTMKITIGSTEQEIISFEIKEIEGMEE